MSTSSSATASGRDQVPSNDPHLKTRICIFIVTRKDGTPLDVTSVSEEDIIEICVALGHTHPLGVLWYLVMESVALFCTTEEMQCTSHGAIKATELQDKPIAIQTMAPLEHHIGCILLQWEETLLNPNHHPQRERVNLIHPLVALTWVGELCIASRQSLATSQTKSCINLWRMSARRLHSMNCMQPPSNPQPTPWGEPSGSGNPNGDDQEVTFLGWGGWVPPRQPSPSPASA